GFANTPIAAGDQNHTVFDFHENTPSKFHDMRRAGACKKLGHILGAAFDDSSTIDGALIGNFMGFDHWRFA
ncbi:hypothetical protein, partial [Klebsiella pneumoniae]|uniref:hypothetical protein n=1 Tax=Klebsiella pneumoniae TaxID=573 RepID=UPI003854515B